MAKKQLPQRFRLYEPDGPMMHENKWGPDTWNTSDKVLFEEMVAIADDIPEGEHYLSRFLPLEQ